MPSSAIMTFADPYEYQTYIRGAHVEILLTAPGEYRSRLMRIDLHNLTLQRGRTSLPLIAHGSIDNDRYGLSFLADADHPPTTYDGMEVNSGDIVFSCPGAEYHHRTSTERHWATISLHSNQFTAAVRVVIGRDLPAPLATRLVQPSPDLMSRLLHLHEAACHLAVTIPDVLSHPEVARAMEQALVRVIASCLTEGTAIRTDDHRRQHRALMIRRFEQAIEANQDQPLYLAEICAAAGASERALRLHCHEHLGMSPHRYLWLRRMHQAKRALTLADATARTVTEIANDHGFAELGRFAVAYRQLFGEAPSMTLRRPPDGAGSRHVQPWQLA
jgi:AraC-like DNA-binding protein